MTTQTFHAASIDATVALDIAADAALEDIETIMAKLVAVKTEMVEGGTRRNWSDVGTANRIADLLAEARRAAVAL